MAAIQNEMKWLGLLCMEVVLSVLKSQILTDKQFDVGHAQKAGMHVCHQQQFDDMCMLNIWFYMLHKYPRGNFSSCLNLQ